MKPLPAKTARRGARSRRGAPGDAGVPEDIRDAVNRLKRERIIATAVELFYDQGLSNTTLEAVAEKLGVTKPFIYSHFKSKAELLAEICSRGIRASLDALNRVVAADGSPTDKLQSLAREFTLAVLGSQAHIAIYNREEKHLSQKDSDAINAMRREFDRKFCALLNEGVKSGDFIVDDVQICSLAIGGMVSWSYVWYRRNGRLTQAETADRVADLVLAMVNVKPARRKRARSGHLQAA
jgi:TetR/AcrR family transcriptional regulator, cholesterol catabolism regulator